MIASLLDRHCIVAWKYILCDLQVGLHRKVQDEQRCCSTTTEQPASAARRALKGVQMSERAGLKGSCDDESPTGLQVQGGLGLVFWEHGLQLVLIFAAKVNLVDLSKVIRVLCEPWCLPGC